MPVFQFAIFLVSAFALPCAALALSKANMKAIGKVILFTLLLVTARYLLGTVWIPEGVWSLRFKIAVYVVEVVVFLIALWEIEFACIRDARPLPFFLSFMLRPLFPFILFGGIFFEFYMGVWGSIAFWLGFVATGLFLSVFIARKICNEAAMAIMFVVFVALVIFCASTSAEAKIRSYTGSLSEFLHANVVERWEPIKRSVEKISDAWDTVVENDRKATVKSRAGTRKSVATSKIQDQVAELRDSLLTIDSKAVLASVKKYDAKISSLRKKLHDLREKRDFNPQLDAKLSKKISRLEEELQELEKNRNDAIETVRRDLKEIGLELPDNSPFLTLDLGALIDYAVVARNIGFVVENLKTLADAEKGNPEAAKRYYGGYIVMLDVQAECFRQYLDKAATGMWRDGIAEVAKNAEAAMKGNEAKANAAGLSEASRAAILHAAGTNEKTLKAANAYLALLVRHEEIIREKLAAVEKRHEIALSFLESVDIASAFGSRELADMADFNALLELKMPEIAFFDDEAMQAEFEAITQKLNVE